MESLSSLVVKVSAQNAAYTSEFIVDFFGFHIEKHDRAEAVNKGKLKVTILNL
jgi:hypothetical protein